MDILIVDDHKVIIETLSESLIKYPEIKHIKNMNSLDGIEKVIKKGKFDIILLDIRIDEEESFEIGEKIKKNFPDIILIFLTSYDMQYYRHSSQKIGAEAFFPKTISTDELYNNLCLLMEDRNYFRRQEHKEDKLITDREISVLRLLSEGWSRKEISEELGITENTVSHHVKNAIHKLGANNKVQAVIIAAENGYIKI